MMIRSLSLSAIIALSALPCAAQTYVIPNGFGGYTVQSPDSTTYVTPNGFGGYYLNTPPTIHPYGIDPAYGQFARDITQQWNPQRLNNPYRGSLRP